MQRIRQAVRVINNEKNRNRKPVITALTTLVAARSITKRITAVRVVPNAPVRSRKRVLHAQRRATTPKN